MSDGEPPQEGGGDLREILDRIREGDEAAARELLMRYEAQVRLVVHRQLPKLLRSRFDSLDFLQSVWGSFFHRVRTRPAEFENPAHLVRFLARAARNKVIDEHRRAASLKGDMRREESLWGDGTRPRDVVADADTPSEVAEAREAYLRLRALLPEGRHAILELRAEGLGTREIGERLGISERTVRRALEELQRRAIDEGGLFG
jgi:RNA polymerase sigma factor (sigma-70 family)